MSEREDTMARPPLERPETDAGREKAGYDKLPSTPPAPAYDKLKPPPPPPTEKKR